MEEIEQYKVLSLTGAYKFSRENGLADEALAIREMEIEWDKTYTSTLRRGFIVDLLTKHGLFDTFKEQYWTNGNTSEGERLVRRYLKVKSDYENYLAGALPESPESSDEVEEAIQQQFALEAHLRDFLAKNLSQVEAGLRLYEQDGRDGVEFPIDNGRIDILAVDSQDALVVIELKLSRGRNSTIGQLLYYMGWVDSNLKGPCRGIIIASEITSDLQIAAQRVEGVSLLKYNLSVSVERVFN
jgi:Endonuclease NucS